MSDPIGAIALRNLQGIGDGPRKLTIDIGKGDGPSFGDTLKRALGEVSSAHAVPFHLMISPAVPTAQPSEDDAKSKA